MKPPVKNGKIKIDDAITYIAALVYPDTFKRGKRGPYDARKPVREMIRRAYNADVFGTDKIFDPVRLENAETFFTWASNKDEWKEALGPGKAPLPIRLQAHNAVQSQKAESPELFDMPQAYDELAVAYGECRRQLLNARRRVQELETENAKFRRDKAEVSAARAEAGRMKKGKRKSDY